MSWTNMMLDLANIPSYDEKKDDDDDIDKTIIHNPSNEEELKALLKL